ncbi:hypothetical protein SESBI_03674 [Sesbania bispinosa]|nr:hypothetical protein SESBI_03674 [Sesbania bispinosa]
MGLVSVQHAGCNNNDFSWCPEQDSDRKAVQLYLDESGSVPKTTLEANWGSSCCEEDSDIFKRHFGSLSNTHKIESRKSLVRRFSARYIVQWDYPGDCKKLFSSPVRIMADSKSSDSEDEAATHIISENRSLQLKEIEDVRNYSEQDLKNSVQGLADSASELIRCPVKENSVDNQLGLGRDQKEGDCEGSELGETIASCKKAFGSLDAAAESVVQSLLKLEKNYGEEVSTGAGAQFVNEAAELLPLIVDKVNAVARLVQYRKNNNCGSRLSVPELDELFGRFAEGISDKIVEIPKEDTSIH